MSPQLGSHAMVSNVSSNMYSEGKPELVKQKDTQQVAQTPNLLRN